MAGRSETLSRYQRTGRTGCVDKADIGLHRSYHNGCVGGTDDNGHQQERCQPGRLQSAPGDVEDSTSSGASACHEISINATTADSVPWAAWNTIIRQQ